MMETTACICYLINLLTQTRQVITGIDNTTYYIDRLGARDLSKGSHTTRRFSDTIGAVVEVLTFRTKGRFDSGTEQIFECLIGVCI